MFIRSQNLFLRPVWAEDWAAIQAAVSDEAVASNLPSVPWPYGEAEARWFASQAQNPYFPHFLITQPYRAHDPGGAEVIGCIGLTERTGPDGEARAELGYWIARAHWHRGYATEAGRALLTLAPMLRHHQLVANCFRDNPASARVLRKLGFRPTGEVTLVTSPARGEPAAAATFAIDLPLANDGDDCGDSAPGDGGMVELRAA